MVIKELSKLEPKQKGTIVRIGGAGKIRQRMMDMGLVNGAEIEVLRVAPLGDPMELSLRGYNLSLRKSEAAAVQVATIPVFPLSQAPTNSLLRIVDVHSGIGLKQRLGNMGLKIGMSLRIIDNPSSSNIAISSDQGQVNVGYGMAEKILVQPIEDEPIEPHEP